MRSAESELTTAEELLVLALDPESGRMRSHPVELLQAGVAGAVLMDLFRKRCITLVDERVVPGPDMGERWCDDVLARIRELPVCRGIGFWVDAFGYEANGAEAWTVSTLLAKGMIKERHLLEVIPDKRYTLVQPATRARLIDKILRILAPDGPPDRQLVALVVCASACGVLDAVVPHATRQAMKERVSEILQPGAQSSAEAEDGGAITTEVYSAIYSPGLGHGRMTLPPT
jgi:hypothetical protein